MGYKDFSEAKPGQTATASIFNFNFNSNSNSNSISITYFRCSRLSAKSLSVAIGTSPTSVSQYPAT